MAKMTRSAKWFFATWMIGGAFFGYGRLAFQAPIDRPVGIAYQFGFTNSGEESPWERLQAAQLACIESAIYRHVPRREDSDTVAFEEACYGERVLNLRDAGHVLSGRQNTVANAAKIYRTQKLYYKIAGLFIFMGLIPWFYRKLQRFVGFFGRIYDVLKRMAS